MLALRYILLVLVLSFGWNAWSDESSNHKPITQENKSAKQPKNTTKLDTTSPEKAIRESIKEASEKSDSNSNEKFESDRKLVEYTEQLAFFTMWLVFATFILAGIAIWQGSQLKDSVNLSREIFVFEQRPWVVVDRIIPASGLDLKSGLSFNFIVKNVGNSPAMNVDVAAVMHLPHRGDVHEVQRDIGSDQSNMRKKLTTMKDTKDISYGHLLVPGNELEIMSRAANEPVEYQKAAAVNPTGEIIIFIVGQVSYRFGGDGSWHESGFIFSVSRKGGQWVTLENEVTPIDDIEIKSFGAGFYAT